MIETLALLGTNAGDAGIGYRPAPAIYRRAPTTLRPSSSYRRGPVPEAWKVGATTGCTWATSRLQWWSAPQHNSNLRSPD